MGVLGPKKSPGNKEEVIMHPVFNCWSHVKNRGWKYRRNDFCWLRDHVPCLEGKLLRGCRLSVFGGATCEGFFGWGSNL